MAFAGPGLHGHMTALQQSQSYQPTQPKFSFLFLRFFPGREHVADGVQWKYHFSIKRLPNTRRGWERVPMLPYRRVGLGKPLMKRTFGMKYPSRPIIVPQHLSQQFGHELPEEALRHAKRCMLDSSHVAITRNILADGSIHMEEQAYPVAEFAHGQMTQEAINSLSDSARRSCAVHLLHLMVSTPKLDVNTISKVRRGSYCQAAPSKRPITHEQMSIANIRLFNQQGSFRFVREVLSHLFKPEDAAAFSGDQDVANAAYQSFWKFFLNNDQVENLSSQMAHETGQSPKKIKAQAGLHTTALNLSTIEEKSEPEVSFVFKAPTIPDSQAVSSKSRKHKLDDASLRWSQEHTQTMRQALPEGDSPGKPLWKMSSNDDDVKSRSIGSITPDKVASQNAAKETLETPCKKVRLSASDSQLAPPSTPSNTFEFVNLDASFLNSGKSVIDFGLPAGEIIFGQPSWVNEPTTPPWVLDGSRSKERRRSLRRKSEPMPQGILRSTASRKVSSLSKRVSFAGNDGLSASFFAMLADQGAAQNEPICSSPTFFSNPYQMQHSLSLLPSSPTPVNHVGFPEVIPQTPSDSATCHPAPVKEVLDAEVVVTQDKLTACPSRSTLSRASHRFSPYSATPKTPTRHSPRRHVGRPAPTPHSQRVLDLDARYQPNLFGTPRMHAKMPVAVEKLANLAENKAGGHAKVVVTEESGRLFVRFKMSPEFAPFFPETQLGNESCFSSSSLYGGTPRHDQVQTFDQPLANDEVVASPVDTVNIYDVSSPAARPTPSFKEQVSTPVRSAVKSHSKLRNVISADDLTFNMDDGTSSEFVPSPAVWPHSLSYYDSPSRSALGELESMIRAGVRFNQSSSVASPAWDHPINDTFEVSARATPRFQSFVGDPDEKTVVVSDFDSPSTQLHDEVEYYSPQKARLPETSDESSLSSLSQTPTLGGWAARIDNEPESISLPPHVDHADQEPPAPATPSKQSADDLLAAADQKTATPPMDIFEDSVGISFTPVNQSTSHGSSTLIEDDKSSAAELSPGAKCEKTAVTVSSRSQEEDDDRAYMMRFVSQSRRKRRPSAVTNTTETGSPVASAGKRQPLGMRSPNTPSPQKMQPKLKDLGDGEVFTSPKKRNASPKKRAVSPTKARRVATNDQSAAQGADADADELSGGAPGDATTEVAIEANTRRSTRARNPAIAQSSIPKAIKIGRAGSVLKPGLSDREDYTIQTRSNTRKNRGNAAFPAEMLARLSSESDEPEPTEQTTQLPKKSDGKAVSWKTPLASYREEEIQQEVKKTKTQPKKAARSPTKKTQKAKPTITVGQSGIAKPKVGANKQIPVARRGKTVSQAAEKMGMVSNGTPAKPKRVTRASSRLAQK